jgi:hypothetical protein
VSAHKFIIQTRTAAALRHETQWLPFFDWPPATGRKSAFSCALLDTKFDTLYLRLSLLVCLLLVVVVVVVVMTTTATVLDLTVCIYMTAACCRVQDGTRFVKTAVEQTAVHFDRETNEKPTT